MNNQAEGLITGLSQEIEILAKTVDVKRDEITNQVDNNLKELEGIVELLKKENVLLHNVPKKLSTQLDEAIPRVIEELQVLVKLQTKELVQAQNSALQEYDNALKQASLRLGQVREEVDLDYSKRTKRYIRGIGISVAISTIVSTLTTTSTIYLLIKYSLF